MVTTSANTVSSTTSTMAVTTSVPDEPTVDGGSPDGTWWNERVFYEIFVRSFQDSNGDGIGDLEGLISRLDYLNDGDPATTTDLGITGVWLMPIMKAESYHGYDVIDYRRIDRLLGDEETFRRFVDEAHARGIAVIIDLVLNHTSRAHPWFAQSFLGNEPYDDWYIWDPDPTANLDAWHATSNGSSYLGIFWEGMPDLNLTNAEVTAELEAIGRHWIEEYGIDGFRLDAIKHFVEEGDQLENTVASHEWMRDYNTFLEEVRPGTLTVGEVFSGTSASASWVPDDVDITFDFGLAGAILDEIKRGKGDILRRFQQTTLDAYPPGQYGAFLTNHDQNRVIDVLFGRFDRAKLAATVLLTNPGVPFIYYGEEIGMSGSKPDEDIRTPMPWTDDPGGGFTTGTPWWPFAEGREVANVAAQEADPDSLLHHYRSLVHLRNSHSALRTGDMALLDPGDRSLYAFTRSDESETLLVVLNFGREPVTDYELPLDGAHVLLGAGWDPGGPIPPLSGHIVQIEG